MMTTTSIVTMMNVIRLTPTADVAYLDIQVRGIFVEVPDRGVVAVGDLEPSDPSLLRSIPSASSHETGDDRGRSYVELQPLGS